MDTKRAAHAGARSCQATFGSVMLWRAESEFRQNSR